MNISLIKLKYRIYRIYLYFKYLILTVLLLPLSLTVYIFRKKFSLNPITSERIGHFAADLDLAYTKKIRGVVVYKFNIWFLQDFVANKELKKMWENVLTFTPRWIAFPIYFTLVKVFNVKIHRYISLPGENFDYSDLNNAEINLHISHQFNIDAEILKSKLILENSKNYICLAIRDAEYLKRMFPIYNWDHHELRNCNIDSITNSLEEFTKKNIAVIRMGRIARKMGKENVLINDYAHSEFNSEYNDLLLFGNCKFVISSGTGMEDLGTLFRKNIYLINFTSFNGMRNLNLYKICLPKNFKWKKSGKYLSWQEIIDNDVFNFKYTHDLLNVGIECEDNTEEQLREFFNEIYQLEFMHVEIKKTMFDCEFSNYIKKLNGQTGIPTKISRSWNNYKFD